MGEAHLDFHKQYGIVYTKLVISMFIFMFVVNVESTMFNASATGCILNLGASSFMYDNASYVEWNWGGFLNNSSCGGAFEEYIYALALRANQTGEIFLNSVEQMSCLTAMKKPDIDILACGIEKLTRGSGDCSDFSVDNVIDKLGGKIQDLEKNCVQSCGSCLRSWENIKESQMESESYLCRFAVLISLTSAKIEDKILIQKINKCLMEQDHVKLMLKPSADMEAEKENGKWRISKSLWILLGVSIGFLVVVIISAWALLRRWRKSNKSAQKNGNNYLATSPESVQSANFLTGLKVELPKDSGLLKFSIKEVYSATNNLNITNLIGEGTAGKVYRGILSNDQHVAVKHIEDRGYLETFHRELKSLSKVRHHNLVALLGYCKHKEQCFLFYELCPNGNLSEWLFGKDKTLPWIYRLRIAIDSAKGLCFLHKYPKGCIVHRDIKPSNILLGKNFEARLSDFGLSKVINLGETYVSSEVRGTFGYVDPEYQTNRRVESGTDVYSYGIVLLQIISGRKVINMNMKAPMPLDKIAKSLTRECSIKGFADPKLEEEYSAEAFNLTFRLALSCTSLKKDRPSMEQVVVILGEALDISATTKSSTPNATPDWFSTPPTPRTTPYWSSTPELKFSSS